MEYIGWLGMVLAMVGTFINARGNRVCFYLWGVSNLIFLAVSVNSGAWPQVGLFSFNLSMCVYGLYKWPRKEVNR